MTITPMLSHPALRPIHSGPMRIPDLTKGYDNLFVVLANRAKRVAASLYLTY